MATRIRHVDAFTDRPFAGNPAAVCLLDTPQNDTWMQHVAADMNLSETAFITRNGDDSDLRWFTPTTEVDLCGHATLASAHILWEDGLLAPARQARFHTRSGLLTADRDGAWIKLDFPALPATPTEPPAGLFDALGIPTATFVGVLPNATYLVVTDEQTVRTVTPDQTRLADLPLRSVIVTAPAATPHPDYDIVSRYFAPAMGIPEDPVTGSAHCCLGPYWAARLGKTSLVGYQASARGGIVRMTVAGDRVRLDGQAVTVLRGELAV